VPGLITPGLAGPPGTLAPVPVLGVLGVLGPVTLLLKSASFGWVLETKMINDML